MFAQRQDRDIIRGFRVVANTDPTVTVEIYRDAIEIWLTQQGQGPRRGYGWPTYDLNEKLYTMFLLRWS